jgi:hypothetical protein
VFFQSAASMVVFQSLNRNIYMITKAGNFKIISPDTGINKSFRTNNSIYFQTITGAFENKEVRTTLC